jgi:non-specific serine/threonine protein kinase
VLASLADPELVPRPAASSLGLAGVPGRSCLETLIGPLRQRQALLVLDNCEHLPGAGARLADSLLQACPALKLLATSREPLGAVGEAVFRVPSLPFPDPAEPVMPEGRITFASVGLFIDRARLVLPGYQVAAHNAAAVARICQRLDGIPLALELAAARVKLLTAEQVAGRLDDTLRLLTGGSRSGLPRHQTLLATLDWSYALLNAPERLLMQRLSVFAGGCTLEAVEAVCAGDGLDAADLLDWLTALVDKSLVVADRRPGQDTRYRLLETVRQYATAKLRAAGGEARLRLRHRDYYLLFTEKNAPNDQPSEYFIRRDRLYADLENLRQAVEWSLGEQISVAAGLQLLMRAVHFLYSLDEKIDWCRRGIALAENNPEVPPALLGRLLLLARMFLMVDDPQSALVMTRRAAEIGRELIPDQPRLLIESLCHLTELYVTLDDVESAARALEAAQAVARSTKPETPSPGHRTLGAWIADRASLVAQVQGDYQTSKAMAAECLRLDELTGAPQNIMFSHRSLAFSCIDLREFDEAGRHFRIALEQAHTLFSDSEQSFTGSVYRGLGEVELRQGRPEAALENCLEGLRVGSKIYDRNIIAANLALAAMIAAAQGQPLPAARLSGAAQAVYARQRRKSWEDSSLDTLLPGWQAGPDQPAIAAAYAEGLAMTAESAVAYALAAPRT